MKDYKKGPIDFQISYGYENEDRQSVTADDFICNGCSHKSVCYMRADLNSMNSSFMSWIKHYLDHNNIPSFHGKIGLDVCCENFENAERMNIKNEFKNCN